MPIFYDSHAAYELPSATVVQFLRAAREHRHDEEGVLPLDFFCGSDGAVYCVVEAPSAEAVHHSHTRRGLQCGTVRDLTTDHSYTSVEEGLLVAQMRRRMQVPDGRGLLVSAA